MSRGISFTLALILIVLTASLGLTYYNSIISTFNVFGNNLKSFNSVEDIKDYVLTHIVNYNYGFYGGVGVRELAATEGKDVGQPATPGENPPEYSVTNVQVEGIDEADYVKTDGRYIYLIKDNKLYIVSAYPPKDLNIVSEIEIPNYTISGLYVYNNKIVLISQEIYYYRILPVREEVEEGLDITTEKSVMPVRTTPLSSILVYDISDPYNPVLTKNVSFAGWMRNSRLMNGILYSMVNEEAIEYPDKKVVLPVYYVDEEEYVVSPDKIYYSDINDYGFQYTILFSLDLDTFEYDIMTILTGYTNILYMSYNNIYLTQTSWHQTPVYEIGEYIVTTRIFKFKIDGLRIKPLGVGEVKGYVNDRLQLDEYNGYLRVSTYTWELVSREPFIQKSYTNIFVLDEEMKIVGSITHIAESEYLYATRFMGDYAYLVTFRRIDPLFVVDLSDPTNPVILGKLKIPGFSSMLQPIWDNLLIGIGYQVDNTTRILSLKISLFDVSDPFKPIEVDKILFNESGWGWSDAAYDIHAILKISKLKYVGIPVKLYNITVKEAYLLLKANKTGLDKIGLLELQKTGEEPYVKWWSMYMRGVYIGDYLYIVTNNQIDVYDLNSMELLNYIFI